MSRFRALLLALLSGGLLALAFPRLSLWPLAWIAPALWYAGLALPSGSPARHAIRRGLATGFCFGVSLFLIGMFWLTELGDTFLAKALPYLALALIQAVPFALWGVVAALLLRRASPRLRPWLFAALWTLLEFGRAWGRYAFPWFFLASSQAPALPLLQILPLTGPWGLSFSMAAAGGLFAEAIGHRRQPRAAAGFGLAAILLPLTLWLGGSLALWQTAPAAGDETPVSVAVVQGNIPKQSMVTEADRRAMLQTYLDLSDQVIDRAHPALVVWPETVVPGFLLGDPDLLKPVAALAAGRQTPLLVGTALAEHRREYNSAVLLSAHGQVRRRYDKVQLVPVGEFFPLRSLLGPIYAGYGVDDNYPDLTPGTLPDVFPITDDAKSLRIGMLICYESAFSWLSAGRVRRGAEALVLMTSDQAFGESAGPYQHADLSRLRAVETRRYLVRAAATGVSETIDPWGRILRKIPVNRQGTFAGPVPPRHDQTLYVCWGEWFLLPCALIVLLGGIISAKSPAIRCSASPPRFP